MHHICPALSRHEQAARPASCVSENNRMSALTALKLNFALLMKSVDNFVHSYTICIQACLYAER